MRARIPIVEYERAVLLALYHCALEHPDTSIWADEAAEIVGCGGQLAIICLNSLAAKKLVDRGAKSGRPTVFMTLAGFAEVDSWEHEIYSRAASVFPGKTNTTPENESVTSPQIPASDRTVTLNHNQPEYRDAVAALDKVIEEFRNDHRLDNELGHEKGALLKALEGGRELLNDTVVNVRIGTALLIEPLQRLVVKYEKELVAALASAAITLLLKIFGLG